MRLSQKIFQLKKIYNIKKSILIQLLNYFIIVFNKCSRCKKSIPPNEIMKCQTCFKNFHPGCINDQEYTFLPLNNMIQCSECRINLASFLAMNYNNFPYGQMQRFVQPQPLFDPSMQIPFIRKKNNNKNNKNLTLINNFKQNEKNEEDEEESEINEDNTYNFINKKRKEENIPQAINSFYFLNENLKKQINHSNEESIFNNNEEKIVHNNKYDKNSNKNSSNIINKLKKISKSKEKKISKKNNFILNKNLLQTLENFDLTNEEKLLYILENFKNAKIDPLILKVLDRRKKIKKDGTNENKNSNILNGNQNNNSIYENEKTKQILNTKHGINCEGNNIKNVSNENNAYIPPQPVRISFPMEDKILFQNLEKFKINPDILDRPLPIKIDLDFSILNKLFIIWDFLITFKDTVFTEKVLDLEIDKNILVFYSTLLDEKNNYQYYKNVLISLLLLCVKNIPYAIQSPKTPRLFLLKSILDNLDSMSFNIVNDSPMVVLKEIIDSYLYNNSIENDNMVILNNILAGINDPKNKENFENNKNIFEKEEIKEDNISKIANETKIYLLHIIIGLCFETLIIKEKIRNEYDNMNSLTITKKGLDESLFDAEKRLKELNRMENFKTLPKDIEDLENKLKELKEAKIQIGNENEEKKEENKIEKEEEKNQQENNNKTDEDNELNKKKEIQELETQIEKYKSILTENDKLIERKKEINTKIKEIIENIYNLKTIRKKYLGIDYQNNEYYYFVSVPDKIFIKNKKRKEWAYYENKDDMQNLINKLTDKGKNEKNLKVILKFIFSQMKEKEQKEKEKQMQKELEEEQKKKEIEEKKNNIIPKEEEKKENNENNNPEQIQIKIEKSQNNENEGGEIKEKITEHVINLGVTPKKRGKTKQKEEEKIDKIQILEDDEEEIVDNKEKKEKEIEIGEKDNNIQNKNKSNINIKKEKDIDIKDNKVPTVQAKKEIFTFIISEERLQLGVILMKIDYVFSEYLIQFNKQWESEKNRNKWKEILTNNATDKNILTSLKMFNHKFKNPYKILSFEEEQELLLKEKINKGNNFIFDEENGNQFSIPETNNLLLLSPKVKIWSKEMDLIDIDNFYNNDLLINVYSREQLCYVVHFYEMAIFGLVHRREGKRKL